jgi:hypothetical protein
MQARLNRQTRTLELLEDFPLGSTVRMATDKDRVHYGAVTGIQKRGRSLDEFEKGATDDPNNSFSNSNPITPSKWSLRISLADGARNVDVPLSKINSGQPGSVTLMKSYRTERGKDILSQFDEKQTGQREIRQVVRGNLLVASQQFGRHGEIVNATTHDNEIEPAILMDQEFDMQEFLKDSPTRFESAEQVEQFFEQTLGNGVVQGLGGGMRLEDLKNGTLSLSTEASDRNLVLDDDLQDMVGNEFYSAGRGQSRMSMIIDSEDIEDVVLHLMNAKSRTLESGSHHDIARDIVGQELPGFSWDESADAFRERLGLASEIDMKNIDTVPISL